MIGDIMKELTLEEKFKLVAKPIEDLFKKDDNYVNFTFTRGYQSKGGDTQDKWNIYTSTLGHNFFNSPEKMVDFINSILPLDSEAYLSMQLTSLEEKRQHLAESLDDTDKEIDVRIQLTISHI
jgi:hypothetical protein